jgi:hypothetical protein
MHFPRSEPSVNGKTDGAPEHVGAALLLVAVPMRRDCAIWRPAYLAEPGADSAKWGILMCSAAREAQPACAPCAPTLKFVVVATRLASNLVPQASERSNDMWGTSTS